MVHQFFLHWNYIEADSIDVEQYKLKHMSRKKKKLVLTYYECKDIVMKECGFTEKGVKKNPKKLANKIKFQHSITVHQSSLWLIHVKSVVKILGQK